MSESAIAPLTKTHVDMEIWWDSSPLVYNQWGRKKVNAAEPSRKPLLEEQLSRLYNIEAPAQSIFRGCTTNPPFSWQTVQCDLELWSGWRDKLIRANPDLTLKELTWLM